MSEYILRIKDLCKKYKNVYAVDNVNMNIKRGDIYGFIGENGAGKTTTIRLITGLIYKTKGEVELFGESNSDESKINKNRKRIGSLIERPAFYDDMTAYENLEACRIQKGIPGKKCVDETLEMLGLYSDRNRKVKNFSLGMKQKLGIAISILGDPEFLILDEPINGLDPLGIVKLRRFLKKLNKQKGMTILISSHILEELHLLATSYGIIHKGKLIEQITSEELDKKCRRNLNIKVDNVEKATIILEKELNTNNFKVMEDERIKLYDFIDNSKLVSSAFSKSGIIIEEITAKGDSLEDYFMNLIGGANS